VTGPDPAVAGCRLAVRHDLTLLHDGEGGIWSPEIRQGGCVLVACSGGADSLALLAATIFEARKAPFRVIGVVVDHGLQDGSAEHTARVVAQMARLGADETASIRVEVDAGPGGIEAGAREARYAALSQLAEHFGADQILLGHTLDDQAETVLLGLTRGSGGRSIAGMRRGFWRDEGPVAFTPFAERVDENGDRRVIGSEEPRRSVHFSRPFLDITRAQTEAACRAEGIEWWSDPQNADPRFVRSRIRHTVMPMLERELGPGIAAALARTADSVREDVDALDEEADLILEEARREDGWDTLRLEVLSHVPGVQTRVLRLIALESGALASDLTRDHVLALSDLILGPDEHRQIQLPGHLTAYREGDLLRFRRTGDLR
jgi:tRNA(Ile)-lysidine synthase